jgi:FkbM family methyltransferase
MKIAKRIARTLLNAVWGALWRNSFVYNACVREGVRLPTIPVGPVEHYGQLGEDIIVAALLQARGSRENVGLVGKTYLEIGGNHPFATSATFLLNKRLGMRGVIVDANPALIPALKKGRPQDTIVHAAIHDQDTNVATLVLSKHDEVSSLDRSMVQRWRGGTVGEIGTVDVPAMRINEVVKQHLNDTSPLFMSIDVEGYDLRLLKDFDLGRYRPWFVQVEYVDNLYPPGNSREIVTLMRSAEYRLVAKTFINLIFESD